MNGIPAELEKDPTYRVYHLSCKTKFITKNVRDDLGTKGINQYTRHMVILIPQESDQRTRFLNAWAPETIEEYHELAIEISAPIHGPSRAAVHRGYDKTHDRPYITIMSKGVEEILLKFPEGTLLQVKTLGANSEDEADSAQDASDGNFELVHR